jgi:transcriptional regulator with XRE-family HTH domain
MPRQPTDIDELVGHNIHLLRLSRAMSQTKLAEALGVTFQQVQKYERGRNRIAAGRLFAIAGSLRVPISAFFVGAGHLAGDGEGQSPVALLSAPYTSRLVQAFCALEDDALRRSMCRFVEVVANVKANLTTRAEGGHRVNSQSPPARL